MLDVVIIGAGAVGCAIARELSFYQLSVLVLEKEADVAAGTSGRNSAVVHAGFNNKPGSLMARLCVEGSQGMEALCRQLDVPYRKTGKVLAAFDAADEETLREILAQGEANGCRGMRLIDAEELGRLAPGVGGISGLLSPETAIFDPFLYTVALAENALENGVSFRLNEEVLGIERKTDENGEAFFTVRTDKDSCDTRFVINAAGLYADRIAAMAGVADYTIHPCRGQYYILDEIAEKVLPLPVYPAPKKGIGGLGVHLTPTIHGNIIIGPNADYIEEKDGVETTAPALDQLWREAVQLLPALSRRQIVGQYAGIRPKLAPKGVGGYYDFVIKEEEACPGLINLIGIESPGLTASVPIARYTADILRGKMQLQPKVQPVREHRFPLRFKEQPEDVQARLIKEDPEYGDIVCRCRRITRREIRDALNNPLGVKTLAGVKYRVFATTGRCQGGYCLTRIADMLVREFGLQPEQVTLRGEGSELFSGEVK